MGCPERVRGGSVRWREAVGDPRDLENLGVAAPKAFGALRLEGVQLKASGTRETLKRVKISPARDSPP